MMKNILYMAAGMLVFLQGCTKDLKYQYDNINRVYFQYEFINRANRLIPIDSTVFSFGKQQKDVIEDTAKIAVKFLGNVSDVKRMYRVKVVAQGMLVSGKTDMIAGEDYEPIAEEQFFRAGHFTDTLKILVYRKNLSNSIRNPQSKTLMLKLEASNDFELGIPRGQEMKVSVNDYLFAPAWWKANTVELGFYHPKKWLLLIDLDPIFAIEDAFAGTGVDMQKKGGMLRDYLKKNVMVDDETGMRITFEGLVPIP